MCGISGLANSRESVNENILNAMLSSLAHRGPDDHGVTIQRMGDTSVGLVSSRLSIIDLTQAGHMPMTNHTEDIWITYNGEIYNHLEIRRKLMTRGFDRFRSRTDTETVLTAYAAYGLDCFPLFNGMFATAILDLNQECLILARDRMGIKPLYYFWDGNELIFASELKAMIKHPKVARQLDTDAVELYLALGYVPSPYSMLRNVKKLTPGHFLILKNGKIKTHSFWTPEVPTNNHDRRDNAILVDLTEKSLIDSIDRQLMSDVPVGVMLSGGIDSTIVASIAREKLSGPLHTFSVGFHTKNSSLEEMYNWDREYASMVAQELGTDHHEITIHDDERLIEIMESLLYALDEPLWELSYISLYAMSKLAKENGVKVLLTGDGSDELFGGYAWYAGAQRLARYERLPFLGPALAIAQTILPEGPSLTKVRDLSGKYRKPAHLKYLANYRHFSSDERSNILNATRRENNVVEEYIEGIISPAKNLQPADLYAFGDQLLWIREHFNQRVDRMTMLASVEGRVPFQDNAILDLTMPLGMNRKIIGGVQKSLLINAFRNQIPEYVISREKRPFAAPSLAWLQGTLRDYALDTLSASSVNEVGILNGDVVQGLTHPHILNGFSRPQSALKFIPVWNLLALCIWAKVWQVTI